MNKQMFIFFQISSKNTWVFLISFFYFIKMDSVQNIWKIKGSSDEKFVDHPVSLGIILKLFSNECSQWTLK